MSFYTETIFRDRRYNSVERIADLGLLEPETRDRVQAIIASAHARGVELRIWETFRSKDRQQALFVQGVTKLRNVGVHHYGLAADIVRVSNGQPTWKGDFSIISDLAHENKLICGADWGHPEAHHNFVDPGHVQRCSLAKQPLLFAGTWYPEANYDPYVDDQ